MKWHAEAPSNIALIKYMGRTNEDTKTPANASLSYTLSDLKSTVELEISSQNASHWEPLSLNNASPLTLSSSAQQRFLNHLQYMLDSFSCSHHFIVRSCNNFPQASGLASSASSFAALTLAASLAINDLTHHTPLSRTQLAQISRRGSGSSCRSFFEPWAFWDNEEVRNLTVAEPYKNLKHQAIVISDEEKAVLSSQAHQQVKSSPFYEGRKERAESRLNQLVTLLNNDINANKWEKVYQITWDEFQDMHHLFETASPAFRYKNEISENLLKTLALFWEKEGDGPLITMDAGPNIHLLYRADQIDIQQKIWHDHLKKFKVL